MWLSSATIGTEAPGKQRGKATIAPSVINVPCTISSLRFFFFFLLMLSPLEPIRKPVLVILRSEATKNLNLQFFSYLNEILRSAQNDI